MRKLLLIFIFFSSCRKDQVSYNLQGQGRGVILSATKNIQAIVEPSVYEAFGFLAENKPKTELSYYYRRGTGHTTGGNLYYRTLNILQGKWSAAIPVWIDSLDLRDVTGGKMDNDSIVLFYSRVSSSGTLDRYIQKCDKNNNFSPRVIFDLSSITLQTSAFFGSMITGDIPGEYYHILYQFNSSRYRISIIKTSDYWNTYYEAGVIYDGTTPYSETAGINLGGGKFLALTRNNNEGNLTTFESTDYGVTWTKKGKSNLYWFDGSTPEIPNIYAHDGVFDILYECRDASMMQISKNNTLSDFGNAIPVYNDPEIYSYHRGVGKNPSLGYGSEIKLLNGKYLIIYSKEYTGSTANFQWTLDDLVTDPEGIPSVPTLNSSAITATKFRVDVTGYSDTAWQNIRYLLQDISIDSNFNNFITGKYRNLSYPAVLIHDVRMIGFYDIYNSLARKTTYYVRIKACNNKGCSEYSIIKVATQ